MFLPLLNTLALVFAGPHTEHSPATGVGCAAVQDAEAAKDVIREYQDAFAEWMAVFSRTTDTDAKEALVLTLPRPDQYAPRLLAIVDRAPQSSEAYMALSWIYGESKGRDLRDEALARLIADFGEESRIRNLVSMLERDDAPTARAAIEHFAERSPHEEVRGAMLLGTAGWLVRFGAAAERATCEEVLETVIREYDAVDLPGSATCGEDARRRLYEVRNLLEGCVAPEIEGIGLDGEPLSIGSHRGKVVLLTFWASWCGGCMSQVPHERELVDENSDRPFVLLGINADRDDPEKVLADAARRGITWRSFRNASAGLKGPITTSWNVRTLPTTYLVGHDGRIVKRWAGCIARRDELREAVSLALAAAESARGDSGNVVR